MLIRLCLAAMLLLAVVAYACGDDSDPLAPRSPSATEPAVRPELFSAVMLKPEEIGEGFRITRIENAGSEVGIGERASYTNGIVNVTLGVTRFHDPAQRDEIYRRTRSSLVEVGAIEENLTLENADRAFQYTIEQPVGAMTLSLTEQYMVFLQVNDREPFQTGTLSADRERVLAMAADVSGRVRALIDDPSSITPVPELLLPTPAGGATP